MLPTSTRGTAPGADRGLSAVADATGASTRASRPLDLSGRTVLLATDGSPGAQAGTRVAQALAAKHHAVVQVISVIDTRPAPIPPPLDIALAMGDAALSPSIHAGQAEEVRTALAAITGHRVDWPVRVMLGSPAASIVQEARRTNAVLVIVGLRRHGRLDRAVHDETALNVMRHATCPVLGVTEGTCTLPTRVLAAMDFSEASIIATRTAQSISGENSLLVLAYVAQPSALGENEGESVIHDLGVRAGFARVAEDLRRENVRFDHVVLHQGAHRSVAEGLFEYADTMQCDLLAAGSVRRGRLDRWLMGSVSTDLVRDGSRSVLIAPPNESRRD